MEVEVLSEFNTVKLYWPDSEELNQQLTKAILQAEEEDPQGMRVTNHGGWHSKWVPKEEGFAKTLNARMLAAGNQMNIHFPRKDYKSLTIKGIWANINRNGHFNYAHHHNAVWAGFYCVDTGDPDPSIKNNGATGLVRGLDGEDLHRLPWKVDACPGNVENTVKEYKKY